jgi:hypothetical protein
VGPEIRLTGRARDQGRQQRLARPLAISKAPGLAGRRVLGDSRWLRSFCCADGRRRVTVADLVWENSVAGQVTDLGRTVGGYPVGSLLAIAQGSARSWPCCWSPP